MAQGPHYLQIPGPSPVPERIQRAIDRQVIDHRSQDFKKLGDDVLSGIRDVFGTRATENRMSRRAISRTVRRLRGLASGMGGTS